MNAKTTVILLVLLILGLLYVAYYHTDLFHPKAVQTVQESTTVLPQLAEVRKVTLQRPGQATIALVKRDGKWRLLEPMDAPAAGADVERLVETLTTLHYESRYAPDSPDRPKDDLTFLATPDQKVTLTDSAGREVTVRIGRQKPLSSLSYVQVEGDDNIYVAAVDLSRLVPSSAQELRNRQVIEAPQGEITRVVFTGDRELELVKQDGQWQILRPVKARADQDKAASLLRAVTSLQADKFVSDNPDAAQLETFGLTNPSATITVEWAAPATAGAASLPTTSSAPAASSPASAPAGQSVTVAFGASSAGNVYARLPGRNGVFQVAQTKLDELRTKTEGMRNQRVLYLNDPGQFTHIDISLSASPSATLERVEGYWRMLAPFAGPADQDAVAWLLTTLRDLKASEYVEMTTPAGLGLSPPVGKITLSDATGAKKVTLLIGRATGESGQMAYVQAEGSSSAAVVPAAEYAILNRPAAAYWPKQLFSLPATALITRIEVQKPDGKVVVEGAPGKLSEFRLTTPVNAPADAGFANPVANLVKNIIANKVVALDKALPKRLADLKPIRLNVAYDVPAGAAPATAASAPGVQHGVSPAIFIAKDAGKSYVWIGGMLPVAVGEMNGGVFDSVNAEPRDRHVFAIPPGKAVAFRMTLGKNVLEFTRSGNQWRYTSDRFVKIDSEGLDRFLTGLSTLQAARFADYGDRPDLKRFGLNDPAMVIAVTYEDGRSDTLKVSRTGPVGTPGLYANSSRFGVFVLAPEESIKMQQTVQGLRKEKAENTPPAQPAMPPGGVPEE